MAAPFRWNVGRRAELGSLLDGEHEAAYPSFVDDLLDCCARALALAGDSDLFFVGRSPESVFDLLSGLLEGTSFEQRPCLMQYSSAPWVLTRLDPPDRREAIEGLRGYLTAIALSPPEIATAELDTTFVDLVASGNTLGTIIVLLRDWTRAIGYDWHAVQRRLRIVGLTVKDRTSPNIWRWQQHVDWADALPSNAIKNVAIPWRLWDYLGNAQSKVTRSHTPDRWTGVSEGTPPTDGQLRALRLAHDLYERGRSREMRLAIRSHLVRQPAMRERWFRALVGELPS